MSQDDFLLKLSEMIDKKIDKLSETYVSKLDCSTKTHTCYITYLEPLRWRMWLISLVSGMTSCIGTSLIIFYVKGFFK